MPNIKNNAYVSEAIELQQDNNNETHKLDIRYKLTKQEFSSAYRVLGGVISVIGLAAISYSASLMGVEGIIFFSSGLGAIASGGLICFTKVNVDDDSNSLEAYAKPNSLEFQEENINATSTLDNKKNTKHNQDKIAEISPPLTKISLAKGKDALDKTIEPKSFSKVITKIAPPLPISDISDSGSPKEDSDQYSIDTSEYTRNPS